MTTHPIDQWKRANIVVLRVLIETEVSTVLTRVLVQIRAIHTVVTVRIPEMKHHRIFKTNNRSTSNETKTNIFSIRTTEQ